MGGVSSIAQNPGYSAPLRVETNLAASEAPAVESSATGPLHESRQDLAMEKDSFQKELKQKEDLIYGLIKTNEIQMKSMEMLSKSLEEAQREAREIRRKAEDEVRELNRTVAEQDETIARLESSNIRLERLQAANAPQNGKVIQMRAREPSILQTAGFVLKNNATLIEGGIGIIGGALAIKFLPYSIPIGLLTAGIMAIFHFIVKRL